MKRNIKRYLAGMLIWAMIVGIFPNNFGSSAVTNAIAASSDSIYLSFDDYRTAYEELPNTISTCTLGRTEQAEVMDKVTFTGDIIFSAEGSATDCTLRVGGNYLPVTETQRDLNGSGIGLFIADGRMYAYNHYVSGGQQTDIGAAAVGYPNRVSLQFAKVSDGEWNVTYKVNGVTSEAISYSQAVDFGPYIQICPNADDKTGKKSITCKAVQEGYTYLSFHDFRVEGINAAADDDWTTTPEQIVSGSLRTTTTHVNTMDKVIFQGEITFYADGQDFSIGGMTQTTTGESDNLSKYDHGIYLYISGGSLYAGNYYRPHDAHTKICDATLGTPIRVKLQFDQLQLGVWEVSYTIDGASGTLTYTNLYPDGQGYYYDFGPQIYFRANDNIIDITSVTGENPVEVLEPVSFDLADGAYLVSGTAVVKNTAGQTILSTPCENPTINTAGDYMITTVAGSFAREQNVSLYKVGDLNFDGEYDGDDYWKLVELLDLQDNNGEESYVRPYKADCAVEYAADLNNNGKVDRDDLNLIYLIVTSETVTGTLKEVLDKYHVPAVSYDALGGKDVMPIVGYYGPYYGPIGKGYDFLTDDIYQKIKKMGINLINDSTNQLGNNTGTRYVYQQLQLSEKYGIGQYIKDATLNPESVDVNGDGVYDEVTVDREPSIQEMAQQIGKYSFYGSYLGTYVRDEPYYWIPEDADASYQNAQLKYYDWLAKKMNQYTNEIGFINAIGSGTEWVYANSSNYGVQNFKQGLEKIQADTKAKLLSFTSYPFASGLNLGAVNHDYSQLLKNCYKHSEYDGHVCDYYSWKYYYRSLWDSREVSQKTNGTFWAYTAAGGDFRDPGTENPDIATIADNQTTEAETYWDVNHKLAFGAKGIEWFPLLQPYFFALDKTQASGYDYTRNGLIGLNGEVTDFGKWAKEINNHIAAIDDVLMCSKSTGVIATGSATKDHITRDGDSLITGTTALGSVSGDTNDNYGALVGCFNYGDTEAFYVVNYHLSKNQSFTLHFNKEYNYRYVSDAKDYTGVGTALQLSNIEPGRGVLVVLDEKDARYTDSANEELQVAVTDMSATGKNITFYTNRVESLYGSSAQESITLAYDTDAVVLNGQAIQPAITEVNDHGVWGFALDMSAIDLSEGDVIRMNGTVYPTSGNERGRLTKVTSTYYKWVNGAWTELPEGYYDVSIYKAEGATPDYPALEGKAFAGWFTDDSCKTVFEGNEGVAYAKYVDAGILANLAQVPVDAKYDTEVTKLRFVSTVDSLDYKQVGFTIEVIREDGTSKGPRDVVTKDVYKKIAVNEGGVEFKKDPNEVHKDSKYFFTYTLTDITNNLFDNKIYVTPFWITLDGTKVCGERMAKTVDMGILINSGTNNDYDDVVNGDGDDDETSSGGFTEVEDPEDGYGPIS